MANSTNPSLTVTIQNRERVLFDGVANAVSSTNEKGAFDILPQHSNFITVVSEYITLHLPDGKEQKIPCREGVLWVTNNIVKIAIDILPPAPKNKTIIKKP